MNPKFFRLLGILIVILALPALAVEVQQIGWKDLQPKTIMEFEDPFAALSEKQLRQLGIYARVSNMEATTSQKVSDGMRAEARDAELSLREQGVDIEGLLKQREEIKALRMKRASATVDDLDGSHIRMPGYALPLEYNGKKVTEFLLVPWVGACIHTPPPPPNQIVHVKLNEGFKVANRFIPVWVAGKVKVGALAKELFFVDGTAPIDFVYSISDATVEEYKSN